jgi:hypothetical protein
MLRCVCERFRGDEVGRGLDGGCRPLGHVCVDVDEEWTARGERPDCRLEPAVAQDRRMDAAGEIAQLAQGQTEPRARLRDECASSLGVLTESLLRHPEAHPERHQPRLRAVVEIALDPAQLCVLSVDGSRAGLLESLDARAAAAKRRRNMYRECSRQAE